MSNFTVPARKRAAIENLLKSGISAVADRGLDHVSVLDVVTLSGVSRPTFYTYFGDISGYYAEMWLWLGRRWLDSLIDDSVKVSESEDHAMIQLFAASRRIPELLEVVQPEFQEWWNDNSQGQVSNLNLAWSLAWKLGKKISQPISDEVLFGEPMAKAFQVPGDVLSFDYIKGLPPLPQEIEGLQPLSKPSRDVDKILTTAAIEVVASSGVAAASITRIARRARVSTGSIYPRFKNLDALIYASFQKTIAEIIAINMNDANERILNMDGYGLSITQSLGESRKVWRNYRTEMHIEAVYNKDLREYMREGFHTAVSAVEQLAHGWNLKGAQAKSMAWYWHAISIGFSILHSVVPQIERMDHRVMTRYLGRQLQITKTSR